MLSTRQVASRPGRFTNQNEFEGRVRCLAAGPTPKPLGSSEVSTSFGEPVSQESFAGGSESSSVDVKRLRMSDHELRSQARLDSARVDFTVITDLALYNWVWKANHKECTLFEMNLDSENGSPQVLSAGNISCSVEEIAGVLASTNDLNLNMTMKGLYRKEFIYGSVVHMTSPGPVTLERPLPSRHPDDYVGVKTGAFVWSRMFARNEEWCFIESSERSPDGDAFRMTQSTIDAHQIRAGKARPSRIDQLCGVTTVFLVEKVPNTRTVRLFFYGKLDAVFANGSKAKGAAPVKATKSKLALLAKGASRVPEIVRRRRLGFQTLAYRSVFAAKNPRCTCCTKSLHFLTKKKRCYLCAYYVCDHCWTQQKMETYNNKIASTLICTRCLECVDSCEYGAISSQKWRIVRVEPDREGPSNEPRGKAVANILRSALDDSDRAINEAAAFLIRHIIDPSKHSESGDNAKSLLALEKSFQLNPLLPLETCVLANAESRNYPIHMPEKPSITAPDFPVPLDEAKRLRVINEDQFLKLGDIAELNIICVLASTELECAVSQVTIVDEESEFILACNVEDLHRIRMARNQTFCSHLIMDDKPLLLNPEADVRFCRLDAVAKRGARFYCGFPITAKDGTVVGSLCCLDFQQRKLTQRQCSTMKKLATTVSRVI